MTDIEKFKSLLEYFISHVDWKQNMDKTHVGFSKYIKPLLDNNSFVESGQGYNGNKIQNLLVTGKQSIIIRFILIFNQIMEIGQPENVI